MSNIKLLSILLALSLMLGCSGGKGNPVETEELIANSTSLPNNETLPEVINIQNHLLLGSWTIEFDVNNLSAEIISDKTLLTHYNVTWLIPPPTIHINSYDPITRVIDVDVTLVNPYNIDVYDVRGIVFLDSSYNYLLNFDNWTSLYDIPGGVEANPFKAFSKTIPNRKFVANSMQTENFQVYLNQGITYVKFAVDASYPGNCDEPYEIGSFNQEVLYDDLGSSADVEVTVLDWQDDVNSVYLHCPAITNQQLIPFFESSPNQWKTVLSNNTGAQAGDYKGYLLASSENSGSLKLYDEILITVTSSSIPSDPKIISSIRGFMACLGIAVSGDYAYVADWWDGLKVVDISDPTYPEIICTVESISALGVKIFGDYAYVIDSDIKIVDLSNPHDSYLIGTIDIELVSGIAVAGNLVYLTHAGGLTIVDVSIPSDPVTVSTFNSTDYALSIAVSAQYAYISFYGDPFGRLSVVDVSNPLYPQIVGTLVTSNAYYLTVVNNLVYMIDDSGVKIVDVTDQANPELVGSIDSFQPHDIMVSGDYAYLADDMEGLKVIDVSTPQNPSIVGNVVTECALGIAYSDQYAYVADFYGGIKAIDVTNPSAPKIIGHGYTHRGTDIVQADNYVYVADGINGLTAVDVSDPSNPRITSSCDTSWSVDIALSSHYVYLCDVYDGLKVFDISVPGYPLLIGSVDSQDYYGIDVVNDTAYIASSEEGLLIIDVSDPSNPIITDSVAMLGAKDVVVSDSYAYVVVDDGLAVVDLTNLLITGSIDTIDPVNIDIKGNIVYLADIEGLILIDASDPFNLQRIGSISFADGASGVSVHGNYAYVTDYETGLSIVDVSDSSDPKIISQVVTSGTAEGVTISNEYAYLADNLYLLEIVQLW